MTREYTILMETDTQRLLHTFAALADLGQEIANARHFIYC